MSDTAIEALRCSEFPNSSDCISRQAAIDELAEQIALCDKALNSFGISMKDEYAVKVEKASLVAYKEQLEALPAVDVVPVIHGKWERHMSFGICDKCGYEYNWTGTDAKNYCPNCGAKMVE